MRTEVAGRIPAAVRPTDVVARFGGDEIVVLLSDVDPSTAREIGEPIVSSAAAPRGWTTGPAQVTVSVGLAPVGGLVHVVDAADRAMRTAELQGRDRLVVA